MGRFTEVKPLPPKGTAQLLKCIITCPISIMPNKRFPVLNQNIRSQSSKPTKPNIQFPIKTNSAKASHLESEK
ncbi:MAG: hypothetical protein H6536_06500 [Bacteroidales bacterium]|nr:hypothetical protein [Bacteroidales bacterium]